MPKIKNAPGGQTTNVNRNQIMVVTANDTTTPNNWALLGDVYDGLNTSPFAAKPTTEAQLLTALDVGGYIYVPSTITMTQNWQLSADTYILFANGAEIANAGGYRIDTDVYDFSLSGFNKNSRIVTYIPANADETFIYSSQGDVPTHTFELINARARNGGSLANTPLCSNLVQRYVNASMQAGDADNAGINITQTGSYVSGLTVLSAPSPSSTNIFQAGEAVGQFDKLTLANIGGATGAIATISFNNQLSQIDIVGGNDTSITIGSSCDQLASSDGSSVHVTGNGGKPHFSGLTVNDLDISASSLATLTGCHAAGTFTPGTGYQAAACTGSIINTPILMPSVFVTGTSQAMLPNVRYVCTNASLTTLTLPVTFNQGDVFVVLGDSSGGWQVSQNANQQIFFNDEFTTLGDTGYISSTQQGQSVELLATEINTNLRALNSFGNISFN